MAVYVKRRVLILERLHTVSSRELLRNYRTKHLCAVRTPRATMRSIVMCGVSPHERLVHERLERRGGRGARVTLDHHDSHQLLFRIDPEVGAIDAAPAVHTR